MDADSQGRQRAKLSFVADCRAAFAPVDSAPIRVAGEVSFTHHLNRSLFAGMNEWQSDGVNWAAADPKATVSSGEFSDAPQCNALIARWHAHVLPCVQAADPAVAARLAQRIEEHKNMLRVPANSPNRNITLLGMEQSCVEYWRQMHRQMDHPPAVAACRLPG